MKGPWTDQNICRFVDLKYQELQYYYYFYFTELFLQHPTLCLDACQITRSYRVFFFFSFEWMTISDQIHIQGCNVIFQINPFHYFWSALFVSSPDWEVRLGLEYNFSWHSPLHLSGQISIKPFVMM